MPPTHVFVTAAEGRKVPLHQSDSAHPYVDPGHVARVRYSQGIRRAINRGDLIPCTMDGSVCADIEHAAAPDQPEHGDMLTPEILADVRARKPATPPTQPTKATAKER